MEQPSAVHRIKPKPDQPVDLPRRREKPRMTGNPSHRIGIVVMNPSPDDLSPPRTRLGRRKNAPPICLRAAAETNKKSLLAVQRRENLPITEAVKRLGRDRLYHFAQQNEAEVTIETLRPRIGDQRLLSNPLTDSLLGEWRAEEARFFFFLFDNLLIERLPIGQAGAVI